MNRTEDQARYYNNLPLRGRSIKAVVHLEDAEDIQFWNHQLQNVHPATYHYITYSKNDKGTNTRGCEQCLRYKPYLTKRFFICIDSDLRQLRGEEGLTAENKIAQTYAYSWENHFCEAGYLQNRFATLVPDAEFDFRIFLKNLSAAMYKPLLYLIYYSQDPNLNQQWNIRKFNTCLPLQPRREELAENGKAYIEKVKTLFAEALETLQRPAMMTNEYLNEENAYLHTQGHQIYKLVLQIGTLLCRKANVAFKSDILDKATHTNGYPEIDRVQADLKQITSA